MLHSLSQRAAGIVQSDIRVMTLECERVGGINLAQGVCDTETPLAVRRGAQRGIAAGINSYTRFDGLAELRQAIAEKMRQYNGMAVDPDTEITVSAGSTGAFYCACLALLDPGDEVIVFEPYYGYHINTLLAAEATPSYVPMQPPDWTFELRDLEAAITPRTKGIIVNTPANPCGKVFTRAELEVISEVAIRRDLFVFTDEIYEYFLYDGRRHVSPGALPGMRDRTITISGYSKTFGITGWRIGYAVSDARWAQTIGYMNDLVYVCAPSPLQHGVAIGIKELDQAFYRSLISEYQQKRDRLCKALLCAGLTPFVPQGAYYVLADVGRLPGRTGKERAMHLLERTGIATVPGEAFFERELGRHFVRLCYAKTDEELEEACRRLQRLQ